MQTTYNPQEFEDRIYRNWTESGAFRAQIDANKVPFAIMMPLASPMAHAFGIPYAIAVGAVLSGGLFGDHCSPISDTTILSSTGAQCDLVDHVKTQLPYACVNGAIAFAAFIFAGFTRSPLAVVLAVALLLAVMMVWGKRGEA